MTPDTPNPASNVSLPIVDEASAPPVAPADATRDDALYDSHGRVIRDLRLSVTDRCNYRCVYCMDPDFRYMPKQELLQLDEYIAVARVAAAAGIEKLRITGGEPTLYPQLDEFIHAIGRFGFRDIAMTTNGSRIEAMPLRAWHRAGLNRLTFSLDSLRDDRVQAITRTRSTAATVIHAINKARDAEFEHTKVNAVVVRDINDDEVADFADFAREHDVDMRLIEFMPLDSGHSWSRRKMVTADEMIAAISARHPLEPIDAGDPHSTSLRFRFADGGPGQIGIIASVSRPFCGACSRLRITADGKVRPCLFSHDEFDLRAVLRSGADDAAVRAFLVDAVWTKQSGHGISDSSFVQPRRTMSSIGG
ncbi:MAG: GTP 3',8-cyclase MoaA [Planctomycetota bacterium]